MVEQITGEKYYEPDKPIPPPRLTRNQVGDREIRLV